MKQLIALLPLFIFSCQGLIEEEKKVIINPEVADSVRQVIKSYSIEKGDVSKNYFSYFGFRDWYRWPLVYPYSLNCIDMRDDGFLCDESNAKNITNSQDGVEQLSFSGIKELSFNKNVLIAKTKDSKTTEFKLFNFEDKSISEFPSEEELLKEARKSGELVTDSLLTIEEYNLLFH